ncbi:hypothetical protein LZ575_03010 [Antarcticibacterium sp. 1MA-6-2]|uniref:hypothetical protein n=1 Tax=Antarcticibacterium sp. 1MA-6-2 TaxID=2908210 RepID=UPI001F44E99A|nr:hypothetical protein [Antarcticibacterium sp. 1MA-6-2]UJH91672.1 hypothetical protein LZ575_03010 [Antarcticibacterium sp. 1MA-6-2]
MNTGEIESFERTISIFPTEIKIISTTKEGGKVIQTLYINDIIDFQKGNSPLIKTYYCKSKDEQTLYQVSVPITENVDQILLTQYNLSTKEAHDLRFLIDSQKALPIEKVGYF